MSRIGATLSGFQLRLLDLHASATAAENLNYLRLASGERIQAPRDNVSGFIALSQFQTDLTKVRQAQANVSAASQVVSAAQLVIDEIRTQLDSIRDLAIADQDQALTADQRSANQAEIDAAITEINRLATTSTGGRRLLDGSADFRKAGINNSQVFDLEVYSLGRASSQSITGNITSAATRATRTYSGSGGNTTAAATFTLSGLRGSTSISVANNENLTAVRDRINNDSHLTGITATASGNNLTFTSVDYGSRARVDIAVVSGTFNTAGTGIGDDGVATLNGRTVTGDGNRFSVNVDGFRFALESAAGFTGALNAITVDGPALTFNLSSDIRDQAVLALPGLQAARLGGLSGRLDQLQTGGTFAGLDGNTATAVRIVDEAIGRLTRAEGLADGFADLVIAASSDLLTDLDVNLNDAINSINQVDDDRESALLARNEALAENALISLANIAAQQQLSIDLFRSVTGFG